MRKTLLMAMFIFAAPWTAGAGLCDKLSVSDAHALTQEQLEGRVCKYIDRAFDVMPRNRRLANLCMSAALGAEELYEERFGKGTDCWASRSVGR